MPKLSFSRSKYARNANGLLGKNNLLSEFVYDYNGYTYWFSFSPNKVFRLNKLPEWLNLALGYGAEGIQGRNPGHGGRNRRGRERGDRLSGVSDNDAAEDEHWERRERAEGGLHGLRPGREIGRASCRERV